MGSPLWVGSDPLTGPKSMTDVFSRTKRSEVMRAVKGKNTRLEVLFRKALWRRGFRYSTNSRKYFGTPDIVLLKYKTVIFVDSCFWHGCRRHCRLPAVRIGFWRNKIETNRARDKKVTSFYRRQGWAVFRLWEHDIKKSIDRLLQTIEHNLRYPSQNNAEPRRAKSQGSTRRHKTTA